MQEVLKLLENVNVENVKIVNVEDGFSNLSLKPLAAVIAVERVPLLA